MRDPGLVGKFLLFCVPQSVKTKETYPTRPGSPTPCKQAPIGRRFLGRCFLGRRFLGRCFLGLRFLGRCFLGRRFLGRRFLGRRSSFSRSSFSRHPLKDDIQDYENLIFQEMIRNIKILKSIEEQGGLYHVAIRNGF